MLLVVAGIHHRVGQQSPKAHQAVVRQRRVDRAIDGTPEVLVVQPDHVTEFVRLDGVARVREPADHAVAAGETGGIGSAARRLDLDRHRLVRAGRQHDDRIHVDLHVVGPVVGQIPDHELVVPDRLDGLLRLGGPRELGRAVVPQGVHEREQDVDFLDHGDAVEGAVVVDLPAEGRDRLGAAAGKGVRIRWREAVGVDRFDDSADRNGKRLGREDECSGKGAQAPPGEGGHVGPH